MNCFLDRKKLAHRGSTKTSGIEPAWKADLGANLSQTLRSHYQGEDAIQDNSQLVRLGCFRGLVRAQVTPVMPRKEVLFQVLVEHAAGEPIRD